MNEEIKPMQDLLSGLCEYYGLDEESFSISVYAEKDGIIFLTDKKDGQNYAYASDSVLYYNYHNTDILETVSGTIINTSLGRIYFLDYKV